jgi:hypothetical protein
MDQQEEEDHDRRRREVRWAIVRLVLGQAQMIGAVVSAYLLISTGMNEVSLGAVVVTCLCTTVSVLLFGRRSAKDGGKSGTLKHRKDAHANRQG